MYLAGLRIRERGGFPDWRRWLVLRTGEPTFPESPNVAEKLLEEIEDAAAKPLATLSDAELRPFNQRMDEIMAEWRAYPQPDAVGQRLLEELRRDYRGPHWRAVA